MTRSAGLETLGVDTHPCEGPGNDSQDFLPDEIARGSRYPLTARLT